MKFDLTHLVLLAAIGVLAWLLFTDGCCGEVKTSPGDTSSHFINLPADSLVPDSSNPQTVHEIIRTVYRKDTAAIQRVISTHDSLIAVLAGGFDAHADSLLDDLRGHLLDSLSVRRFYTRAAGDSLVKIDIAAQTIGYLDSLTIGWKHDISASAIPARRRTLSAGFTAGSDTLFAPGLMLTDRKGRSFAVGYEVLKGGVTFGVHWPVWGR